MIEYKGSGPAPRFSHTHRFHYQGVLWYVQRREQRYDGSWDYVCYSNKIQIPCRFSEETLMSSAVGGVR
jgi:hypothetical protein